MYQCLLARIISLHQLGEFCLVDHQIISTRKEVGLASNVSIARILIFINGEFYPDLTFMTQEARV